jgi:hypothetical protein
MMGHIEEIQHQRLEIVELRKNCDILIAEIDYREVGIKDLTSELTEAQETTSRSTT